MKEEGVHFKVLIPAFMCEQWIERCLRSLLRQTYQNWHAVVSVEPCEDWTYEKATQCLSDGEASRISLHINTYRKYAIQNYLDSLQLCSPTNHDVIVFLDGDDCLYDDFVLAYLNRVYCQGFAWITWGSYISKDTGEWGRASQPMPKSDVWPLPRQWRYSHLKTFRYFLFKGIKDEDLRYSQTRQYYTVAWDMALMFPMIEMAGQEHCHYVKRPLYIYNQANPFGDEKQNYFLCQQAAQEICNREPYSLRTEDELCQLP
jgi:glycosyltransferase involved in cell wall biosynthesis